MKILGIGLLLVLALSSTCGAVSVSYDVYPGFNCIAAPLVPINPDPIVPLTIGSTTYPGVFAQAIDGIDGLLVRNDPATGGIPWDGLEDPPGLSFGKVLLGDGYWLTVYSDGSKVQYEGLADGVPDAGGAMTDMWISLPGAGGGIGGWHLIGQPFNHDTPVDDGSGTGVFITFTNGSVTMDWSDAVAAGWVSPVMTGNDPATGGVPVQYDGLGSDDHLRAGKGYWVQTFIDNLAMIIPAYTSVP